MPKCPTVAGGVLGHRPSTWPSGTVRSSDASRWSLATFSIHRRLGHGCRARAGFDGTPEHGEREGKPPPTAYASITTTTGGGLQELATAAAAQAKTTIVPNVVGTSLHSLDRLKEISAAGLDSRISPEEVGNCTLRTANVRPGSAPHHWSVISQTPAAGSRVQVGSDVVLTVREC